MGLGPVALGTSLKTPHSKARTARGGQAAKSTLPDVELFTDGGCLGNPGPGGWAYILRHPSTGRVREASGGQARTTNNRMEITAVIRGLRALTRPSAVTLCSDSQYVVNAIREWIPGWKKRGWKKANKQPVLNVDLWRELDALLDEHEVTAEWTRGHAGHAENERCDELANAEALKYQKGTG